MRSASAPRRGGEALRRPAARAPSSSSPSDEAQLETAARAARCFFRRLHRTSPVPVMLRAGSRLLRQPALILGGQDLAGDRRGRLHHQPSDLALELGDHPLAIALGGFAGLARSRSAAAVAFCVSSSWTRAAAARASSISCLPLALAFARISWRSASIGELRLDLLGVGKAFGDLLRGAPRASPGSACRRAVEHGADDPKLMICAIRCGQSTPNVRAISSIRPPLSATRLKCEDSA